MQLLEGLTLSGESKNVGHNMRAYKFLSQHYGLVALRDKRLKLSQLKELNDPFELRSYDLSNRILRQIFIEMRDEIGKDSGIACFSSDWCDPVIWSHYSDKHRGLCLGFEIPDNTGGSDQKSALVTYIEAPLHFPENFLALRESEKLAITQTIHLTKFKHWEYEHEIRVWAQLQNQDNGHYFFEFDETLQIKEVIIGASCNVSRLEVEQALGDLAKDVAIMKARPAHHIFAMVEDEEWSSPSVISSASEEPLSNSEETVTKTSPLAVGQELIGSIRSFGAWGPTYQVTALAPDKNGQPRVSLLIIENGEIFDYPLSAALADPLKL